MGKLGTIRNCNTKFAKWYIGAKGRIAMRSGYEVAYAHYLDAKGIAWDYEPMTFYIGKDKRYKGSTYTPDFWLPVFNTFVEIKGRYPAADKAKVEAFIHKYPQYNFGVAVGKAFREYVGKHFMAMGGTAPPVTDAKVLEVLNSRICFR